MKTYTIELQRITSMSNSHGMIQARVDASVLATKPQSDDEAPATSLSLSVENARVLLLMLKAQLAEVDGRKARSQR